MSALPPALARIMEQIGEERPNPKSLQRHKLVSAALRSKSARRLPPLRTRPPPVPRLTSEEKVFCSFSHRIQPSSQSGDVSPVVDNSRLGLNTSFRSCKGGGLLKSSGPAPQKVSPGLIIDRASHRRVASPRSCSVPVIETLTPKVGETIPQRLPRQQFPHLLSATSSSTPSTKLATGIYSTPVMVGTRQALRSANANTLCGRQCLPASLPRSKHRRKPVSSSNKVTQPNPEASDDICSVANVEEKRFKAQVTQPNPEAADTICFVVSVEEKGFTIQAPLEEPQENPEKIENPDLIVTVEGNGFDNHATLDDLGSAEAADDLLIHKEEGCTPVLKDMAEAIVELSLDFALENVGMTTVERVAHRTVEGNRFDNHATLDALGSAEAADDLLIHKEESCTSVLKVMAEAFVQLSLDFALEDVGMSTVDRVAHRQGTCDHLEYLLGVSEACTDFD